MTDSLQAGGFRLDKAQVFRVDPSAAKPIWEAGDDQFQQFLTMEQTLLRLKHEIAPETSRLPTYQPYAQVVVNGRKIASLDNNGFLVTDNALAARLGDRLPGSVNGKSGPDLAQARAEMIARLTGGQVIKAGTAMSQAAYDSSPVPRPVLDEAGMRSDPEFSRLAQLQQARAQFLAQSLGQQEHL